MDIPLKTSGDFSLPVIGFGTYLMGGRHERDVHNNDEGDIAAIRKAVELGMYHIDTAEVYANGYTERLVGWAIKGMDRSKLCITSKVRDIKLGYDDVITSARESLDRLGITQFDLFLVHKPNPEIPITATMRAMDYLVENGITRHIGVSNFIPDQLAEAQAATKYKIVTNQIHFSVGARGQVDRGTLDYCAKNDILVTAYRPIGKGILDGAGGALLAEVGQRYDKTPAQVAINWVIGHPNVVTLVKSSHSDRIAENLGALGWELSAEDRQLLTDQFPVGETINLF